MLRPLQPTDVLAVLAAFESDPMNMARQGDVTDLVSAQRYVSTLLEREDQWPFAVVLGHGTDSDRSGDGELVGLVGLTVDRDNLNGWFWYWTSAQCRGRGWTSRAAATVADWALDEGGLYRLELGHRVNNPASGAVARAAGFIKEGTERGKFLIDGRRIDVDTYSRLATDPPGTSGRLELVATWSAGDVCSRRSDRGTP